MALASVIAKGYSYIRDTHLSLYYSRLRHAATSVLLMQCPASTMRSNRLEQYVSVGLSFGINIGRYARRSQYSLCCMHQACTQNGPLDPPPLRLLCNSRLPCARARWSPSHPETCPETPPSLMHDGCGVDARAACSIFLEDQGRSGVSALIGIGATVASLSTPHRGVVAEHVPSHAQVSTIVGLNF